MLKVYFQHRIVLVASSSWYYWIMMDGNNELGPRREVVEGSNWTIDGVKMEKLSCGHLLPAGPPRQTQTPGKIYRHCIKCKEEV